MSFEKFRSAPGLTKAQEKARSKFFRQLDSGVARFKWTDSKRLSTLTPKKLYMSDPARFNDPYDLKLDITENVSLPVEVLQAAFGTVMQKWPDYRDFWLYDDGVNAALERWAGRGSSPLINVYNAIEKRIRQFGVSCFSTDWNIPLMWSHYGKGHAGLCLQYFVDHERLISNGKLFAYPVNYTTTLPKIPLPEVLFSPGSVCQRLLATKGVEWAYEKEWRLIDPSRKGAFVPMPVGITLGAIIVGMSADDTVRESVIKKARTHKIPVFFVSRQYPGFDLTLEVTWPH